MTKRRLDEGQIEVVDEAVAEILRKKTPGQRMSMVADAWDFAREWIESGLRSNHPDWDESDVRKELSRRLLNETA